MVWNSKNILFQTIAGQNSMFIWCRDHRLHHRYSDTDADPHNSKRGFFFYHMGWLMHKKHPYVLEFGRKIDMSDLQADWMVMFQKKPGIPNFLHAFPWDYKAAKLNMHFNHSPSIIRFFERVGMAYDLKIASPEVISYMGSYETSDARGARFQLVVHME